MANYKHTVQIYGRCAFSPANAKQLKICCILLLRLGPSSACILASATQLGTQDHHDLYFVITFMHENIRWKHSRLAAEHSAFLFNKSLLTAHRGIHKMFSLTLPKKSSVHSGQVWASPWLKSLMSHTSWYLL